MLLAVTDYVNLSAYITYAGLSSCNGIYCARCLDLALSLIMRALRNLVAISMVNANC